jgi:hypothetical protein
VEVVARTRVGSRWRHALAVVSALACILLLPFCFRTPSLLYAAGGAAVLFAVAMLGLTRAPRRIHVDPGVVVVDGRRIDRAMIHEGFYVPALPGEPPHVVLRGVETVEIEVEDEARGRALLATLGLDVDQHAVRFRVVAPARGGTELVRMLVALVAVPAWIASSFVHASLALVVVPALVLLADALRGTLHVGTDGVLLNAPFDRHFIPWKDVSYVGEAERGVEIVTKHERVVVPISKRGGAEGRSASRAAILNRLRTAMEAHAHDGRGGVAHLLDRGERPVRAWLASLSGLAAERYRTAALRTEDLVRELEQGGTPWARLAAAVILARDVEERPRIRVAAEACAEPKLRVALLRVAEGADEATLEADARALDDVEAVAPKQGPGAS